MPEGPDREMSVFQCLPTVLGMGTMQFDPVWAESMHSTDSGELLYVTAGRVSLLFGGEEFIAEPGDVLLVPPETPHCDRFDLARGLEVFMVFFQWAAAGEYFARVSNHLYPRLPWQRKAEMSALLEPMRHGSFRDVPSDRLAAAARLAAVLLLLLQEAEAPAEEGESAEGGRRQALMQEVRAYLDAHYAHPLSLQDIADALGLSPFYLSHVFREESGFSLFSYLTGLRMERARELLAEGRLHVREVAEAVGYEDANYFSRVFRRHFGLPPSHYDGSPAREEA